MWKNVQCSLNYTILGAGVCWWLIRSESQGIIAFSLPAPSALVLFWSITGAQMRLLDDLKTEASYCFKGILNKATHGCSGSW